MQNRKQTDPIAGIYLRPITYEDTHLIVTWRNSDFVRKRFLYREPFTVQSHENWMKTRVETGQVVQFIICDAETDAPLGSVYIRDIDHANHKAEYGIFLGSEAAAGRGIGTAAAKLMLAYCFDTLKLHKVYLRVIADNVRAVRSYEKAGFTQEAYLKDEVLMDGEYLDIIFMAILETERNK